MNSVGHIPLLAKEGWPRHQKMVPFRNGADGVVARGWRFGLRFETFACERPPRLRRFGGFATFYWCRSHPSSRGGECAQAEQFANSFTGSETAAKNNLLVSIFLLHAATRLSRPPRDDYLLT